MKDNSVFRDGIHASLIVMHTVLVSATKETHSATEFMARNEQVLAIGAIVGIEDLLEMATMLYQSVVAMHRCKL